MFNIEDGMDIDTHNLTNSKKRPASFSPQKEPPKKIVNDQDRGILSSLTMKLDIILDNTKPILKDASKSFISTIREPILMLITEALSNSKNEVNKNISIIKSQDFKNEFASIQEKLNLLLQGTKQNQAGSTSYSSIVSNPDNQTITLPHTSPPTPISHPTLTPTPPSSINPPTIRQKAGPHIIIKDLLPDTNEQKSLLEKIKEVSNPSNLGFNIKGCNNTNKNRVIIHLDSDKDCTTLKNNLMNKLDTNRIEISAGVPTLPRIAILGVPKTSDDISILNSTSSTFSTFPDNKLLTDSLKIIRRTNGNAEVSTVIIECSPTAHTILSKIGHFFIDFNRCKLEPAKNTRQCFRCGEFGHNKNSCSKDEICLFCSLPHPSFSCPSKDDKKLHTCSNCSRSSPNLAKHSALSNKCPFIKQHSSFPSQIHA